MNVQGRKVLVTGGAVRVGEAICRAFAQAGAHVIIHCNHSQHQALVLLEELGGTSSVHSVYQCDLSDFEALGCMFEDLGQVDILINNASTFFMGSLADEDLYGAQLQFDVNYWAPMELMRAFHAQNLPEGNIINILDQRIDKVDSIGGSYPISKKALHDATLQAALQWAPNIRVNGVAPGPVLPPVGMEDSKMEKTLKEVPLKRKVELDDLTDACLFLVKNESITGNVVYVDCGHHLT